jgi:hypothetical protein
VVAREFRQRWAEAWGRGGRSTPEPETVNLD